jgi:hypothetical protein
MKKRKMKKSNSRKTKKNKLSGGNNYSKRTGHNHNHNHNKTVKLKKINCSPKPKNEINNFSCYTNKSIIKLRDLLNERHPDAKINTNSPKEIHNQIDQGRVRIRQNGRHRPHLSYRTTHQECSK